MIDEATSADTNYDGDQPDQRLTVTNDDDDTAGITVNPTSGPTTTEVGGFATFTVVLDSEPTDDVTITLSSSDERAKACADLTTVTFTPVNWERPADRSR